MSTEQVRAALAALTTRFVAAFKRWWHESDEDLIG